MPKLQNVTSEDLKTAINAAEDLTMLLHDINSRIEKSYVDDIANPIEIARAFNSLTMASATTANLVLFKASLQEQKAELERTLRSRK